MASYGGLGDDAVTKSFEELIRAFASTPESYTLGSSREEYHSPEVSYELFLRWLKMQDIDAAQCIANIVDVMNRSSTTGKVNSVAFIGPAKSGKTAMITAPLQTLTINNGLVNSAFLLRRCIGRRAIYMDDCYVGPEHVDELKLLFGGESLHVIVRRQEPGTITRTPVFITGRRDPWLTNRGRDEEALLGRMHRYSVKAETERLLTDGRRIHPGMWHYALQQYGQAGRNEELLPLSELTPYPG